MQQRCLPDTVMLGLQLALLQSTDCCHLCPAQVGLYAEPATACPAGGQACETHSGGWTRQRRAMCTLVATVTSLWAGEGLLKVAAYTGPALTPGCIAH